MSIFLDPLIGLIGLAPARYTPIFDWLGTSSFPSRGTAGAAGATARGQGVGHGHRGDVPPRHPGGRQESLVLRLVIAIVCVSRSFLLCPRAVHPGHRDPGLHPIAGGHLVRARGLDHPHRHSAGAAAHPAQHPRRTCTAPP
ncbi:hypothetical protein QJS66_13790 [Kocuria rhizophila]|nr:hypothetical protein QJS66_13790 [Kocuria rhizophila]